MTALHTRDLSPDPPSNVPRDPRAAPHTWRAALAAADAAPRCGARCRTRGHAACRNPAMANGRCRMHGGASTGARTEAGRERCRRARTRHGGRSAYWVGQRKLAMKIRREGKRLAALVDLRLMAREAETRGIETGLDWDDLPFRPIAVVEARKTLLAARMLAETADTPPPHSKSDVAPHAPGNGEGPKEPPSEKEGPLDPRENMPRRAAEHCHGAGHGRMIS